MTVPESPVSSLHVDRSPCANYVELLLSACSTYDKKIGTPGKQKSAVYAALVDDADNDPFQEDSHDGQYDIFQVDTDISDILAYNTNMH